jgi:hypothetical protein
MLERPVDIPDPWQSVQTYAEDFYAGGDFPEGGVDGQVDASKLEAEREAVIAQARADHAMSPQEYDQVVEAQPEDTGLDYAREGTRQVADSEYVSDVVHASVSGGAGFSVDWEDESDLGATRRDGKLANEQELQKGDQLVEIDLESSGVALAEKGVEIPDDAIPVEIIGTHSYSDIGVHR